MNNEMKAPEIRRGYTVVEIVEMDERPGALMAKLARNDRPAAPAVMNKTPVVVGLKVGDVIDFERRFDAENDRLLSVNGAGFNEKQTKLF